MGLTVVQVVSSGTRTTAATSFTSGSIIGAISGGLLVAGIGLIAQDLSAVTSVVTNKSQTFTLIPGTTANPSGTNLVTALYYVNNVTATTGLTTTLHLGSSLFGYVFLWYITGAATGTVLDAVAIGSGTTITPTSAPFSTLWSSEIICVMAGNADPNNSGLDVQPGYNFDGDGPNGGTWSNWFANQDLTTTPLTNTTTYMTNDLGFSEPSCISVASFIASGATGPSKGGSFTQGYRTFVNKRGQTSLFRR